MDRMKKLLMMDSRTFNRMTTPKDKVLISIEGEMSSILNDDNIPEDVKAKLYASKQSQFLKIEHPQWGETSVTNTKTLNTPHVLLDTLPNSLVRKAKRICDILRSTNRVWVNDKNEFVIDGDGCHTRLECKRRVSRYIKETTKYVDRSRASYTNPA